jgi:hypothetical protein
MTLESVLSTSPFEINSKLQVTGNSLLIKGKTIEVFESLTQEYNVKSSSIRLRAVCDKSGYSDLRIIEKNISCHSLKTK